MKIFKHSIENFCEMLLIVYSTQYPNCVFLYLFQMRWWTWPLMDLDVSYIRKRGIEIKNELFAKPHRTHWRTITKSLLSLIWAKTYTARSLWIQKTSHLRLPGSYWLTTPIMKNVFFPAKLGFRPIFIHWGEETHTLSWHKPWLFQTMECRVLRPSHYLNHCLLIVN